MACTAVAAVLMVCGSAFAQGQVRQTPEFVPNRVIVKFKADANDAGAAAVAGAEGGLRRGPSPEAAAFRNRLRTTLRVRAARRIQLTNAEVWDLQGQRVEDVIAQWRNDPRIQYIEPDYIVRATVIPNDPSYGQLYGMTKIQAPEAWDLTTGSANVVVGVIDTGVDYTHPDLAANMWTNPGESGPFAADGLDNDNNGFVDDVYGYDFVNNDGDPMDDQYHGTHVAGTIAAVGNNGIGVTGVSWTARIMALKFLGSNGTGSTSDAVRAIQYATLMGARLTNNSWGGGGASQALLDAINAAAAANSLFVAAAGNSNQNTDTNPTSPASLDLPNIISVAATDANDAQASFSNYGATSVDLGAPGVGIYSTLPNQNYGTLNGTSMAAPHVSGVAALILARHPTFSWEDVKGIILASVDPVPALAGITVTGGRLNAFRALTHSDSWTPIGPPIASITPSSFSLTLNPDVTTTQTLAIANTAANGRTLYSSLSSSCAWLSPSPSSAITASGATSQIQFSISTVGLLGGSYPCTVAVTTNDPALPAVAVPVSLTVNVLAPPLPSVAPGSFSFTVTTGLTQNQALLITNGAAAGAANLRWTATVLGTDTGWLSLSATTGVVAPQADQNVTLTASAIARAGGIYQATIRITTLEGVVIDVPVTLIVQQPVVGGRKLYIFQNSVQRANLDGSNASTVYPGGGLFGARWGDVDEVGRKLYWTQDFTTILRSDLDGTNRQVLHSGLTAVTSVAVDAVHGHLYWLEAQTASVLNPNPPVQRIGRSNLDGSNAQTVVATSGNYVAMGLRLDVAGGKMYWVVENTSNDALAGIYRANLDGTNVQQIVPGVSIREEGLDLDLVNGKLYWSEIVVTPSFQFFRSVRRANLDGTSPETLYTGDVMGLQLDLAGGYMYWIDRNTNGVQRWRLDGTSLESIPLTASRGIALDLTSTSTQNPTTTTVTCTAGPFTYTGAAFTPCTATVTGTNGLNAVLPVTYTSNVNAGTATASATYAGDATNLPSSDSKTFTIGQASSVVSIACPAAAPYTGAPVTPCTATAQGVGLSQALPVTYANNVNLGSATASATFAGDVNHTGSSNSQVFAIQQAQTQVQVSCQASEIYSGLALTPCTALAVAAGGFEQPLTVTYTNNVNAGTATASATFAGTPNYAGSSGSTTFEILKASSTTSVTCPTNATFTGSAIEPCTATATGVGGLNQSVTVTYTNNTNVGQSNASATFAGDANHTGSTGTGSFSIDKAPSSVSITCPATVTFTGSPLTPCTATATGAGGLNQGLTVTHTDNTNAGTATASASFAGDANHLPSDSTVPFTIGKATSSVVITCPSSVPYTGASLTPCTAVATGAGGLTQVLTVTHAANVNAGSGTASATFVGDANHEGASDTKSFTIAPAPVTVTVTCPASVPYTGAAQTPCTAGVTGVGGLNQVLSVNYTDNTNVGQATAAASYAGDANHTGGTGSTTFAITQAAVTVTVTCPAAVTFTGAALTPCGATVTGPGGLNQLLTVSYSNNTNAGLATASATFAGTANHSGGSGTQTFSIQQAASVTTVTCPAQVPFTGTPQTPCSALATGAGGLSQVVPVTYTNNVATGIATAAATFAGGANHAGSNGTASFSIGRTPTTVTVTCSPATVTYTGAALTPCTAVVTAPGLNQSLAVSYTNNVNAGTATASASFAGDALYEPSSGSTPFTIAKASSTVTLTCPASATYTGLPVRPCTATVTGAGGLNQSQTVTYLNNTAIGTATATATYAGGPNHTGNSATRTFLIRRWFF